MQCNGYWSVVTLLFVLITVAYAQHRFGYSRPDQKRWARKHGSCGGKMQSPIAISARHSIPLKMPAIEMVGYHNPLPGPLKIFNNGHSVTVSIPKPSPHDRELGDKLPYIFGGRLDSEYELEGMHWHWGETNNRGSEHVLNDIRFPMEMHIIHRNRKYADMAEALSHGDGLTVLAFFYQLKETDSRELAMIIRNMTLIEQHNTGIALDATFSLSSLLTGDLDTFYTYKGSLTTPPCSEAVTWVLFPDTLPVSVNQMNKFRRLTNDDDGSMLVNNYRHLQPVGNRRVFVRRLNPRHSRLDPNDNSQPHHYSQWDWLKTEQE